MVEEFYGFTLYDGTIFINKDYFIGFQKTKIFITFLILFHEYGHILSLLEREDKKYFYDTVEFLKNNKKILNNIK